MAHRKWKETMQLPSMFPGPAVPGSCLVSFHILQAILTTSTVFWMNQFLGIDNILWINSQSIPIPTFLGIYQALVRACAHWKERNFTQLLLLPRLRVHLHYGCGLVSLTGLLLLLLGEQLHFTPQKTRCQFSRYFSSRALFKPIFKPFSGPFSSSQSELQAVYTCVLFNNPFGAIWGHFQHHVSYKYSRRSIPMPTG